MKNIFHRLKELTLNLVFVLLSLFLFSAMGGLGRVNDVVCTVMFTLHEGDLSFLLFY